MAQELATFTYDPAGNRVSEVRSNNVRTAYTYDANNRLASIVHRDPLGAVLQSFGYSRDHKGRVTRTDRETGEVVTFAYDALGRVTREEGGMGANAYRFDWSYDENGNRIQSVTAGGTSFTTSFTYGTSNRVTSSTTGTATTTYSYDANGSRTLRDQGGGFSTQYSYDSRNRLVSYKESYNANSILYC